MAQSFTQIQTALDNQLVTVTGINASGANANFISENSSTSIASLLNIPNPTGKVLIRSTLVPAQTTTETIGAQGYVRVNGIYAIDIMGQMNSGFSTVKGLADLVLAAFTRGTQLTLGNGDLITIESSSPAPNVNQGAWTMNKLYCTQVQVKWFGFVQP